MSIIKVEGTIFIEMVEVYAWIEALKAGHPDLTADSIHFDIEQDALILSYKDAETVAIDSVILWTWLNEHHLPRGFNGFETVYGVPFVRNHALEINFASDQDENPRQWSKKPACLAEWKAPVSISVVE